MKKWDAIWINATIVTCEKGYGLISPGAIAVEDNKIAWIGAMQDLPALASNLANEIHDIAGCCVTPGFIDCHTHLVYGGNRANEFAQRLQGVTYEEITRQGGGIQSTVNATRTISEEDLLQVSLVRAKYLLASGVTTLEIKSGYGLDHATELKMLRVAKQIEASLPITVVRTYLGAHTVPKEFLDRADDYVDFVCQQMIPEISEKKLAEAVDVFCEKIAFNIEQTERVFKAAREHGLKIKCHAEQLSDSGSVQLAAQYQALSVDHLEYTSVESVKRLSETNTVAVLLPGAFYFLREKQLPPIELLRQYQIPLALASDCNPGTSPILSLLLILNMACTLFRLTPEEAFSGVTIHAAQALGLERKYGTLTVGKIADLAIWDVKHPVELVYYMGANPLRYLVKNGKIVDITKITGIACDA